MIRTLSELAIALDARLKGDEGCPISGIAPLQTARAGQISFLDNPRYRKYLANTQASAVILNASEAANFSGNALITQNPYLAYAKMAKLFEPIIQHTIGIHKTAVIGDNCQIDSTASIGPFCVLADSVTIGAEVILGAHCVVGENCSIGQGSHLYPRVTLYHGVKLAQRVIVHAGVVLGADGFGIAKEGSTWHKVPQLGGVSIGNDVEIGANTTIDRGALEDTVIEEGVKLDNQIQIAHNVRVGAHTAIAGCTGVSGSTVIGKNCIIGGATGFAGHLTIADYVVVTGMAMVTHSILEPGIYSSGTGLLPNRDWQKNAVRFRQLDEIARRLKALEQHQE